MKIVLVVFAMVTCAMVQAQTGAVTTEGKKVMLYDDGTWEYKNDIVEDIKAVVKVDARMSATGEMKEMYFVVSPRLERFFSGAKNKIRGKSKCLVESGQAKISFQWETYLGDGNRYFGYLKAGKIVTLKMKGGDDIVLTLTEGVATDVKEKYNVTVFTGTALVTQEQLRGILKYPVESIIVDWKKNPEEYKIDDASFFRSAFQGLLNM